MNSRFHFFIVLFLLLVSTQNISAGISQHIAYQGVLTDTAGNPRPDGLYLFTFKLYDVESGGAGLWNEEKSLYVKKGMFSTFLGNVTPFGSAVMFNKPYWLGITVGSAAELTPRIPLGSAASCLRAQWADTAEYARGTAGGDLTGTFPSPTIDSGVVTSKKITDGTIQRADVAANFKAPFADSSDFADVADSAKVIASNAVTTSKIVDGTIERADVAANFKAPFADSADVADTAKYAITGGASGTAGGDLTGTYPNPSIAANAVNSSKIVDATIQRADVAADFKAPFADSADFAYSAFNAWGANQDVGCFVFLKNNQGNIPGNTYTPLNFDSAKYDFGGDFNTSTHEFTAPVDGYYEIYLQVNVFGASDYRTMVQIYKDDLAFSPGAHINSPGVYAAICYVAYCTTGQKLTAKVLHDDDVVRTVGNTYSFMIIGLKYRK